LNKFQTLIKNET